MTLQKKQAIEPLMDDLVGQSFRSYLLERKIDALSHGAIVPDDLISELEKFKDRNIILEIKGDGRVCCSMCLKAYALKKAAELGLGQNAIAAVRRMIPGETGHNGYYMDGEELIRVE